MDPDEALKELRELLNSDIPLAAPPSIDDFGPLFEALDEWLTRGGYLPKDWGGEWR